MNEPVMGVESALWNKTIIVIAMINIMLVLLMVYPLIIGGFVVLGSTLLPEVIVHEVVEDHEVYWGIHTLGLFSAFFIYSYISFLKRKVWAKKVVVIASIFQLSYIPAGTILGGLMLVGLYKNKRLWLPSWMKKMKNIVRSRFN